MGHELQCLGRYRGEYYNINQMRECTTCSKLLVVSEIKYHNGDSTHVFCDAYCTHKWYMKVREHINSLPTYREDKPGPFQIHEDST